jgi:hypothetical protein
MVLSRVIRDVLLMSASSSAFVSNNWAGGAHTDNGRITKASADLVVPECKVGTPAYKTVDYSLSGWVGIDGLTCNDVVLQAGEQRIYSICVSLHTFTCTSPNPMYLSS